MSGIPTTSQIFRNPPGLAGIVATMSDHDQPSDETLRAQIRDALEKIPDTPTLLFCSWMVNKIIRDEELPPPEEIKPLQAAFVRMLHAVRDHTKMKREDFALVERYVNTDGISIARPLAATVRHLRETRRLTRRQLARLSGFPVRWLIALERGQIDDLTLDDMERLGRARVSELFLREGATKTELDGLRVEMRCSLKAPTVRIWHRGTSGTRTRMLTRFRKCLSLLTFRLNS
jgi:transcriptional regulator with XRE-family HTH domain